VTGIFQHDNHDIVCDKCVSRFRILDNAISGIPYLFFTYLDGAYVLNALKSIFLLVIWQWRET